MRRLIIAFSSSLALSVSAEARADLAGDAERLAASWTAHGATVERLAPVFLEHGRSKVIGTQKAGLAASLDCLTVAFLTVRTTEFLAMTESGMSIGANDPHALDLLRVPTPKPIDLDDDPRARSAGGVATLVRCGARKGELARVVVEMMSQRAAMEILVARSPARVAEVRDVLAERAVGQVAPRGDAGGPIEPGPLGERLARSEKRAREAGAAHVTRVTMQAGENGTGQFDVKLSDGCHRVEVMAEVPQTTPRRATDIDAEARVEGGRLLARDRADVPDARLDFCVGESTIVNVPFLGASGTVSVTLSDAMFPIPAAVPAQLFGARARAGFAFALSRRRGPDPKQPPIFQALGAQASTVVPLQVERGHCYLASVALVRGEVHKLRIAAAAGDRVVHDEVVDRPEGAAIAFCAKTERSVMLDVDASGSAVWWALAVWPMGAVAP